MTSTAASGSHTISFPGLAPGVYLMNYTIVTFSGGSVSCIAVNSRQALSYSSDIGAAYDTNVGSAIIDTTGGPETLRCSGGAASSCTRRRSTRSPRSPSCASIRSRRALQPRHDPLPLYVAARQPGSESRPARESRQGLRPPSPGGWRALLEGAPARNAEATQHHGRRAHAGDAGLHLVEPDEDSQQQPPRREQAHQNGAEKGHRAREEHDRAVEVHAVPGCGFPLIGRVDVIGIGLVHRWSLLCFNSTRGNPPGGYDDDSKLVALANHPLPRLEQAGPLISALRVRSQ